MELRSIERRWRSLLVLGAGLVATVATAGSAPAQDGRRLTPGAVFTQTNTVPNYVSVFRRTADGKLVAAGQVLTGGNGQPAANPPLGLPFADSAGNVELSSGGDNKRCLFVTNIGSNTVSSFAVRPDGIKLVDQRPTNGSRPISLTSNSRGPMRLLLYVVNSNVAAASIQGYYVSGTCGLTPIPGSHRSMRPDSQPAQIAFNARGTALSVTKRFSAGGVCCGDIDIFPVDASGVAGVPITSPSSGANPYGQAWTKHDQLTVSNANVAFAPGSTVSSYQLTENNTLIPIAPAQVLSPGVACWNVITDNGKFLYVTNPAGQLVGGTSITVFSIGRDGSLAPAGPGQDTLRNGLDLALSNDSRYLYVLSDQLLPFLAPFSAIDQYAIDPETGQLTPIGVIEMPGNSTSGIAAW